VRRRNSDATERTIKALSKGGRLEPVDDAMVGLARATAQLLDHAIGDPDEPTYARAAVVRAHLAALVALTGKETADVDAGIAEVVAALSTPLGKPTL